MSADTIGAINFDERGLVPAVVQEAGTGMVLMVAWMNAESVRLSLETGYTHFWSRSRGKLWKKGESSGHLQKIREMRYDCDADCLLVSVDQTGPACHTGQKSCFYRDLATGRELAPPAVPAGIFQALEELIADRRANPREGSYVNYLLAGGEERVRAKLLEESRETAEASRQGDRGQLAYEAADLLFHLLVLLAANGLKLEDAARELAGRFGKPHKKEKNQSADR